MFIEHRGTETQSYTGTRCLLNTEALRTRSYIGARCLLNTEDGAHRVICIFSVRSVSPCSNFS